MDLLALPSICAPKPVEQALKRARIEPPNPFAWDASPAAPEQELVSAMTAATVDAPSAPCPSPLAAPRALAVPTSRFSTGDGLSRQRSGDFARQSRHCCVMTHLPPKFKIATPIQRRQQRGSVNMDRGDTLDAGRGRHTPSMVTTSSY
ncbi:hypothetical protein FOA52_015953 [Chlamydomonas sp. UWO 241]|nr:hypothetical protein FOA52_015953 [Chlamydomonas sp. UWO 241]